MPRYLGRHQIAVCMRSGIKCLASELVNDGRDPSLRVLPEWADPAQPQERPYIPDDLEGVPHFKPSPEPDTVTPPVLSGTPEFGPQIHLSWTAAVRAAGPRIEFYRVYRNTGAGFLLIGTVTLNIDMFGTILGPDLGLDDTDVIEGESYIYRVIAFTSNGLSIRSNDATVTMSPLRVVPDVIGDTLAEATAEVTGVDLVVGSVTYVADDAPINTVFIQGPVGGTTVAIGTTVNLVISLGPPELPTAPVLSGEPFDDEIDLSWTASTSGPFPIEEYTLFRSVDDGPFTILTTIPGDAPRVYDDMDVARFLHRYEYYVVATNEFGVSPDSNLLAYAQRLALFVAGLNADSTDSYMTSPDGINWTLRSNPAMVSVKAVCFSPELQLFVSVGFAIGGAGGGVQTSPDGITWTTRTPASAGHWNDVCWSAPLGLFVAVANDGDASSVMTSPDGINWTLRTTPAKVWNCVRWLGSAGLFAAGGVPGALNTDGVMTSPDGINWTLRTVPLVGSSGFSSHRMNVSDDYFICSNRSELYLMKSTDGIIWSLISFGGSTASTNVEFGAGTLVATTLAAIARYSLDNGDTWASTGAMNGGYEGIVYSPELSLWVAVGADPSNQGASYSVDGITWTVATTPGNSWNCVYVAVVGV